MKKKKDHKYHEWVSYIKRSFVISNRKYKNLDILILKILKCRKCGKSKTFYRIFSHNLVQI
jgi:hypothetical protein